MWSKVIARFLDRWWSRDRLTRFRLQQWAVTLAIYVASGAAMGGGVAAGWIPALPWAAWCAWVAAGLGAFYAAIRSGWSRRFADGALTEAQIVFGIVTTLWGYAMCGPVRSATLFSLMVILTFGAFSLSWRRMFVHAGAALLALTSTVFALHRLTDAGLDWRVDVANIVLAAIMLPATSMVAGLLGALRRRLELQRAEMARIVARVQDLATRDELTGLANRRQGHVVLQQEGVRSQRLGMPHAVALVDIDHFKRVNDQHGHEAGDRVLQAFADISLESLREGDVIARWGGEEFLVVLPATSSAQAMEALERLLARVRTMQVPGLDGIAVTVSGGVAQRRRGEPTPELLARADRALYEAKRRGRDRLVDAEAAQEQPA